MTRTRCQWATSALNVQYHDEEWGVPVHDDKRWFEFLILEGAQVGLSWETILRKRERYREVFAGFDPAVVACYGKAKEKELLTDAGIVRNRLKISSAIGNAQAFLAIQEEFGSFDAYIWQITGGAPRQNSWKHTRQIPAKTPESDALSKELKRRGFRFVGSTICYALMQATGLVNDHLTSCFRYSQVAARKAARRRTGPAPAWRT